MPIIKTIFQLNAEFMRAETQLKAAQQQPIRVVFVDEVHFRCKTLRGWLSQDGLS